MEKTVKLQMQANAIGRQILSGKVKNVFAAKNKVQKLKKEIERIKYFEYLSK